MQLNTMAVIHRIKGVFLIILFCLVHCSSSNNPKSSEDKERKEKSGNRTIFAILGGIAGILAFAVLFILYKRLRKRIPCLQKCLSGSEYFEEESESWGKKFRARFTKQSSIREYFAPLITNREWIPEKSDFSEYVKTGMAENARIFRAQFDHIQMKNPNHPTTVASQRENRHKNRYINILPYDDSRVPLKSTNNEPGSDYINASFLPGCNSETEYIAAQAPLMGTLNDFWRMIWEQECEMIVMLTDLQENGGDKCEKYWPSDGNPMIFDEIVVEMQSEQLFSEFIKRRFIVERKKELRNVTQMQFTEWSDFSTPKSPSLLVNFIRIVRDSISYYSDSPIVVHCSAGVGRTGTFITLDYMMNFIYENEKIDVYDVVLKFRNYRRKMVQSQEQYLFIYACLEYVLQDEKINKRLRFPKNYRLNVSGEPCYVNIFPTLKQNSSNDARTMQKEKVLNKNLFRQKANSQSSDASLSI